MVVRFVTLRVVPFVAFELNFVSVHFVSSFKCVAIGMGGGVVLIKMPMCLLGKGQPIKRKEYIIMVRI